MLSCAEYIWLDGTEPTKQLRSKARILQLADWQNVSINAFPEWGYDGSSTYQAPGHHSDLVLKPVNFVSDPIRGDGNFLVMCEVFNPDGTPHKTNTRAELRRALEAGGDAEDVWIGFEQEYTLFQGGRPYGWPEKGVPGAQGPYYCAVGADRAWGRELVEAHTSACLEAGLMIYGINGEVMPAQWEFQVGYRGFEGESADPLNVSDHLWLARWLLCRIGEDFDISVSLAPKPMKGDWNGAGAHTNISTRGTRDPKTGWDAITRFVDALSKNHPAHIAVYGHGLEDRLTGHHETCDINTFKMGERDRGASIRIPDAVSRKRYGYIEDRRPGANCDPYQVSARLLVTLVEANKGVQKPAGSQRSAGQVV